ncbi:MAG: GNAT family N-acetyltransferase [Actinomycetota bacterium]|nr:GNAT family N-acetyltransferase [Actinomycetota bacterium]
MAAGIDRFQPCDAVLSDGGTVCIRAITADDADRLVAFHSRLSPESIYLRYFSAHPHLRDEEVARFTWVDGTDRMAIVATIQEEIVGVARYDRTAARPQEADVAFVVEDRHQGRGLATILLEHLAAHARGCGITTFRAETLWQNHAMQGVFSRVGFERSSTHDGGVVEVVMDISTSDALIRAVADRERTARVASVRRILEPRSVAVIGASHRAGTIGHELVANIVRGGFGGAIYPINKDGGLIVGRASYPSILDVPGEVDLAVVAVPAAQADQVLVDCGQKGVRGVVVISAGFAEVGAAGGTSQRELLQLARRSGYRMVGPNCMGIINTAPSVSLNATFAPVPPAPGHVAFASQSGGLGIAILEEANRRGIGTSSFVSMGNKADISGNDLLEYWEQDDATGVILLYLESLGNPRRFARIARRVSRTKPIIAVKSGRSLVGRRAASSHTAALASPDAAVDALFTQTGVIRVDTLEEMFDCAQVLSAQPVPVGRRVGILTNAGGPGILAADACAAVGLEVPELASATLDSLRSFLPASATVANPVDMIASASAEDYGRALGLLLDDENVDAVLVIFVPPLVTDADDVAAQLARVNGSGSKPVVANFLGMVAAPAPLTTPSRTIPSFCFPEAAVRALGRACRYGEWRNQPTGEPCAFVDVDRLTVSHLIDAALDNSPQGRWLSTEEAFHLLGSYGIRTVPSLLAANADDAVGAAQSLGFPVALKGGSADLLHKTERGAVRLGLSSGRAVREAYEEMERSLGTEMGGAVVQPMVDPGVETIVGLVNDPAFGPLIMFGTGGVTVELFQDRSFRVLPMARLDAAELVRSTRGSPLLFGFRGAAAVDVASLEDLILRAAQLADEFPEIAEMDLNPVVVSPAGVTTVDAKMRVAPAAPRPDLSVRSIG